MTKRIVLVLLFVAAVAVGVWVGLRFARTQFQSQPAHESPEIAASTRTDTWAEAVEKVKEDRGESGGVNVRVETPSELKHYEERHWFLAAQVAEVAKHKIQ